jgi:hypothetical protein
MRLALSPATFSVAFCMAYVAAFLMNLPLFRYYPVARQWAWGAADAVTRPGPTIVWYGLMASALLAALGVALIVPDRWTMASCRGWLWIWPYAAVAACAVLLRAFFL